MRTALTAIFAVVIASGAVAQEADTVKKGIKRQWTLSEDFSEEKEQILDTAFSLFHRYRVTDKYSPFNAWAGNYGQPLYQISFFDRVTDPNLYLSRHYIPFMHLPGNSFFMNTQVPYTELVFNYAGPRDRSDQTFRIRHSQNVNRKLNFGLIYDIVYNLGQYSYQRLSNKTFTFHTSYTGDRYKLYMAAGLNNILTNENGGISDKSQMPEFETRDIAVNLGGLSKAKNTIVNRNLLLVQRYTIGGQSSKPDSSSAPGEKSRFGASGTFSHILVLESARRSYSDSYPLSGFYDTVYNNRNLTFDTLSFRQFANTVRFDFTTDAGRKFRLGGGFGIRNELHRYYQGAVPYNFPAADKTLRNESSNIVLGKLFNNIGERFRWNATGEYHLTGFRAGDFNLRGEIVKSFAGKKGDAYWKIKGSMSNLSPSIWMQWWSGNNFRWNDDLLKEFRISAGTEFSVPGRHLYLKLNYALIDNYTDFGLSALPEQHTGGLSVISAAAGKQFTLWKFNLTADVVAQQSSNTDVLSLPLLSARSAFFIQHNFHFKLTNGNLNTQLGAEVTWNSPYYGYSYMPATGVFFRQNSYKTGNYPYLNAFLNVKIKRTRIFLTLDHFNAGLTGYEYFLVPGNPLNIMMFRYGIAWTFYD